VAARLLQVVGVAYRGCSFTAVAHLTWCAAECAVRFEPVESNARWLIGTRLRPSAVLLSETKIMWPSQSRFSMRTRYSSLSFLIPVSRIRITMSRKRGKLRLRQLQSAALANNFFSASSSSLREPPYSVFNFNFGAGQIRPGGKRSGPRLQVGCFDEVHSGHCVSSPLRNDIPVGLE
jgi:hypothetical protein